MVPDALLVEIEPEARPLVRSAFLQRLQIAAVEREQPPEQQRGISSSPRVRPAPPLTEPDKADRQGLRYLLRWALWEAVDTLEAGVLLPTNPIYQPVFMKQCARLGRVYKAMKNPMGLSLALVILYGELRLLRHRGSAIVEQLIFE
jgi:hypothetical protein